MITSIPYYFISYSRHDRGEALTLARHIEESGYTAIMAGTRPHLPGWEQEIFPAIDGAALMVVLMSPDAMRASGVSREISYAASSGKPVITTHVRDDYRLVSRELAPVSPG